MIDLNVEKLSFKMDVGPLRKLVMALCMLLFLVLMLLTFLRAPEGSTLPLPDKGSKSQTATSNGMPAENRTSGPKQKW